MACFISRWGFVRFAVLGLVVLLGACAQQTAPTISQEARLDLGRQRMHEDPVQAELLFVEVLAHDPRNTSALNNLGITHDLLGDHAGAQGFYGRALAIAPTMRAAQTNLALSMALSGQLNDAIRMLRALAQDPDATRRTRHDLALALVLDGDRTAAGKILAADMPAEDVARTLAGFGRLAQ